MADGSGTWLRLLIGWPRATARRWAWGIQWSGLLLSLALALGLTLSLAPSLGWLPALGVGAVVAVAGGALIWQLLRLHQRLVSRLRRQWWVPSLRAARLTRRMLGVGAYRELCRTGHLRIASGLFPERTYLVPRRTSPSGARVLVEEHHQVIGGLCLRPRRPLPDPEEALAHILLLRSDEAAYLAAANFFPYDTVLTPQAVARRWPA